MKVVIIWLINTLVIIGLFSFVSGVGATTVGGLIVTAVIMGFFNGIIRWLLPLAGVPFNLASFILALIIVDSFLLWLFVAVIGYIYIINQSGALLVIGLVAVLSWFIQSLGYDYNRDRRENVPVPAVNNKKPR